MHLIQAIGAAILLGVGAFSALLAVQYERRRLSVLDGWIDLLHYIKEEIDCHLLPIEEILKGGDRALFDACMASCEDCDLDAILDASSLYLDEETKRLLSHVTQKIGGYGREEQVKKCSYYIAALQKKREKVQTELPLRIRLAVVLSLCVSLGSAILLW